MNTEIAIRNIPTFANKELNAATKKMCMISETLRKSALETAAIIAHVSETECFKDDGFNTVHEWVGETFGFKKSASYTLLKIGSEYLTEVVNSKGKVTGYVSNLVDSQDNGDYSVTQIEKMLPGGWALAKELTDNGETNPGMTCKEIEAVIKRYTKSEDEPEQTDTEPEQTESDTEPEQDIVVTDEHGNKYAIPVSVLEQYRI